MISINITKRAWDTCKTSSATAEIDYGPGGASTLSSWRSESSNTSLVILYQLIKNQELADDTHLLEKWFKQCKLGHIRQVAILLSKPLFLKVYKIEDRPTDEPTDGRRLKNNDIEFVKSKFWDAYTDWLARGNIDHRY